MRALGWVLLVCVALVGSAHASFINYSSREINVKLVYYAPPATTAAHDNLVYIYGKTSPEAKGKMIQLKTENDENTVFFDFLPLKLGEIRGFKVRFHLYTVVTDTQYSAARTLILKGVDGVIFIADADPARARANVESLAELKKILSDLGYAFDKMPIVFQLVGTTKPGAVPIAELTKSLGIVNEPVFEADVASGVGVFDTLKASAKLVLTELKKGAATDTQPKQLKKTAPAKKPKKR